MYTVRIIRFNQIPISELYLSDSFSRADKDSIVLRSGLPLSNLSTVVKIGIYTEAGRNLTEEDVLGLLRYVEQSESFKELWFYNCPLPLSIDPDSIPTNLKTKDIKVLSPSSGCLLHLHSGHWIKADDVDNITKLCSYLVIIDNSNSESQQQSTIDLLVNASKHDIPISVLGLYESFSNVDDGNIILKSGLRLSGLSSVQWIGIQTEGGREMTQQEIVGILMYGQQSHRLKDLSFYNCLLPPSIPAESIPSFLKSNNLSVQWYPRRLDEQFYSLHLQSGRWLKGDGTEVLTDAEYTEEVNKFREYWRDDPWQQNRLSSGEA